MSEEIAISLDGVRFYAFIGVMDQERRVGNEYVVDVTVRTPVSTGMRRDSIEGTVSYADIYDEVKGVMTRPAMTLEYVVLAIADRLRSRWPELSGGELRLCKVAPPLPGIQGKARVTYRF